MGASLVNSVTAVSGSGMLAEISGRLTEGQQKPVRQRR
jgi:hypothetical protein